MTEVVYVIQNPPYLHKLSVRFSQPKRLIYLGFSMNMNVYMHSDHILAIYNIRGRVVSDIQSLAFGPSLYI